MHKMHFKNLHRQSGMTDEEIDASIAGGDKKTRGLYAAMQRLKGLENIRKYLEYRNGATQ